MLSSGDGHHRNGMRGRSDIGRMTPPQVITPTGRCRIVKPNRVLVFGTSGHARVVIDILRRDTSVKLVGCIGQRKLGEEERTGIAYLGMDNELEAIVEAHDVMAGIVAIGDNWRRHEVVSRIQRQIPGFWFIQAIHPTTVIGDGVEIGAGTVVTAGCVISTGAKVGEHCVLNTRSVLDHDSCMGDFASLAPGATVGGDVQIGAFTAIGLGSDVIHGRNISEHVIIGAGSVVTRDIPPAVVAYGIPAKIVRSRRAGEGYL